MSSWDNFRTHLLCRTPLGAPGFNETQYQFLAGARDQYQLYIT